MKQPELRRSVSLQQRKIVLLAGHTGCWCYFGGGAAATLGTFFHSASTAGGSSSRSLSIPLRNIAIFQICSYLHPGSKARHSREAGSMLHLPERDGLGIIFNPVLGKLRGLDIKALSQVRRLGSHAPWHIAQFSAYKCARWNRATPVTPIVRVM